MLDAGCWMLDAGCWIRPSGHEGSGMSYRDLEVWQLARSLTVEMHRMTITSLPRFEMFEVGSQVRRSSKSVRSNIVEGYGRRRYKQEFIRFLTYALASSDETRDHLEVLWETGSLTDEGTYSRLVELSETLGKKLNTFIASVEAGHRSVREGTPSYGEQATSSEDPHDNPASSIQNPASDEST
jgi:four helix bundle protein